MLLKKPVHVIQIFDNSYEYGKDLKSFEDRKEHYSWKKQVISKNGIIENKTLKSGSHIELENSNLLLLIDYNSDNEQDILNRFKVLSPSNNYQLATSNETNQHKIENEFIDKIEYHQTGSITKHDFHWKCLKFSMKDNLEVHLKWTFWEIGFPTRDNFKICELSINNPTEINVNGKRDSSAGAGRARTYVERNFIIEYKGLINDITDLKKESFIKIIPKPMKRVNLLKKLY